MNKINENQMLGITIGVVVVLVGGIGFASWWFWEKDYKVKVAQRDKLTTEIAGLEKKKVELAEFRKALETLKASEAEIAQLLPTAEQVTRGEFLSMLSGFERQAQVVVSAVSQVAQQGATGPRPGQPAVAAAPYDTVEFKFTVKGGYYEVVHFMYLVESHTRIMKIVEGDITPERSTGGAGVAGASKELPQKTPVTLNVKVATYVYKVPKDAGAAKPGGPPVPGEKPK